VILDEVTSALDAVSEEKIAAALEAVARSRTLIVIAHRMVRAFPGRNRQESPAHD
jgi:ABC-type multidrug transport system fused ATPase/permease subunit